jgi:hypothetical protein
MRTRIVVGVLILLCAVNAYAQEQCKLKLAELPNAPELFGFRMGMSPAEVKVRVPQVAFGKANEFGVGKTSINPDFDPRIDKASLVGVRTVSLDFLDDRLVSLWFGFDSSFKWKTIPEFVAGISQSLHLPNAWDVWKVRGQRLRCADFQMTVINVAEGPSFRIIDETAEQTVAERRAAKEEADAAAEEAEAFEIIADTKTRNYYPKSCPQSESIDESNRILFKTREEAEKAGYKLAKLCR